MTRFTLLLRRRLYGWPIGIVTPGEFFGGIAVLTLVFGACFGLPVIFHAAGWLP